MIADKAAAAMYIVWPLVSFSSLRRNLAPWNFIAYSFFFMRLKPLRM